MLKPVPRVKDWIIESLNDRYIVRNDDYPHKKCYYSTVYEAGI